MIYILIEIKVLEGYELSKKIIWKIKIVFNGMVIVDGKIVIIFDDMI